MASSRGQLKMLCVMDSIGKTAGSGQNRQYWKQAEEGLNEEGIAIIVKFQQGASFSELVDLALQTWNQSFHFTQIISFGNDLFLQSGTHIKDEVFENSASQMAHAFQRFSAGCESPQREVVFGGVASQWDVQNPDVFESRIQSVMGRFRELTDLNAPHMELTHAKSWVSGLNSSHWNGFHLQSDNREFAITWLSDNVRRSWHRAVSNESNMAVDNVADSSGGTGSVEPTVVNVEPTVDPLDKWFVPTYDGPWDADNGSWYYMDNILCKAVWRTANLNPAKVECFKRFGKVEVTEDNIDVQDVYGHLPTVFMLTSGMPEVIPQVARACSRFDRLGYGVVMVQGLQKDFDMDKHGLPANSRRGHLTWWLIFFPKLMALTKRLGDDQKFLVAEDSCMLSKCADSRRLAEEARKTQKCMWIAYRSNANGGTKSNIRYLPDSDGRLHEASETVKAPYGLKMLLLDRTTVRLLWRMTFQLSLDHCLEDYFKMLVYQEVLHVCNPALGGSDEHYSLVDGEWQQPSGIRDDVLYSCIHNRMA